MGSVRMVSPIAAAIVDALDNYHPGLQFTGTLAAREHLLEARFEVPSWEALAHGLRPDDDDSVGEPGVPRHGWQRKAMRPVNERFIEGVVVLRLLGASRALLRSQSGPFSSLPFTSFPYAPHACFDPQPFRVLLLRRLWLPLPLSSRSCRCGRPLDSSGHQSAACAVAGVLGWRSFALESAAARVCMEAGGRVTVNVRVQDVDPSPSTVPDSPWTRHWSLNCARMGPHTLDAPTWTVQPWTPQGVAKRPRTRSFMGAMAAPDWLSWVPKWEADGPTNPPSLPASWPRPKREGSLQSSAVGPNRRGHTGGGPSWHAPSLSHCRCWRVGVALAHDVRGDRWRHDFGDLLFFHSSSSKK